MTKISKCCQAPVEVLDYSHPPNYICTECELFCGVMDKL